ncbi:MAG: Trk system potassium transporter TrkA [Lachnospiraceae bacterium]
MNIIVVGCGKVGYTLIRQLSKEDHDIAVIDQNAEKIQHITEEADVMGVVGNGVSHQTLQEAGISAADLLIAVTGSDEENLLCCLIAKKAGHCQTIARVRNPIYNMESDFLKKEFDLAMIINPELTAAREIAKIFQFPSAIRIDSFAKGHVELLHCKISKDSPLDGMKLSHLHQTFRTNVLVCTVTRGDEVIIPNGDFVISEGDIIGITASRKDAMAFFQKIGIMKNPVKNAIIAGGGKISYYLAKHLIVSGINVTIIEINRDRCEFLTEQLPEATIIWGDATDQTVLSQEGLEHAHGFVCLTGLDEENILLALHANDVSQAKTVTKINRISFNKVIDKLDLGSIIYPRVITSDYIVKFVRSTSHSINSNVETLYQLANGKAEAVEFIITPGSAVINIPLMNLHMRKNTLICCIYRKGRVIVPSGQDVMKEGDSVVVVLSGYRISDIQEILEDH